MPLVIHIKPGESIIIGRGVVTNRGQHRTHLEIEGDMPILHEKEVLRESAANTPCKRLYVTIQTMYLSGNAAQLKDTYSAQLREILQTLPSASPYFKKINDELQAGHYHKALKETWRLIEHEGQALSSG